MQIPIWLHRLNETASGAAALALALIFYPFPVAAQSVNPADVLTGFWNIEWRRPGDDRAYDSARVQVERRGDGYEARGCHTVYRSPARPNGVVRDYCGWKYGRASGIVIDGEGVTVREPVHVLGSFGGTSRISFSDRNTAQGTWIYERGRRRAAGTVTWRRSRAQISRIVLTSEIRSATPPGEVGNAKLTYDHVWTSGRGYREGRPRIAVEIYGTEIWGSRTLAILNASGRDNMLEIYDRRPIVEPVPGHDKRTREIGVQFLIAVWRDAKYGRKRIFFDGHFLPFEFRVDGHPGLPRIGIVKARKPSEAVTARLQGNIPKDDLFWFRAEYLTGLGDDASKTKTMTVDWQGGSRHIVLSRSREFPNFYLAGPYYGVFTPPETARGNTDSDPREAR